MERLTLYHQGIPVTHHSLSDDTLSIGTHDSNDLVLAGHGVAEKHLVVFKEDEGHWRARPGSSKGGSNICEDLTPGIRISLGSYDLELERSTSFSPHCEAHALNDWPPPPALGIAGSSASIRLLRRQICRLGPLKAPVLISGDTGTGKELVARGMHDRSKRSDSPFIAVNCGGLTSSLLEDTLFGHERGAFTGAGTVRKGVFEQTKHGTLFLDEVGEIPMTQQAALLRVLDHKRIRRIGAQEEIPVDFRLVTATNRNLLEMVDMGKFRLDLYHRISALKIETTALKDRIEDVEPMAAYFLKQMSEELSERKLDDSAICKLQKYFWPGNARELRNILYRSAAATDKKTLGGCDIQLTVLPQVPRKFRLEDVPNEDVMELLNKFDNNVAACARELGVPRSSLRDRVRRLVAEVG